MRCGTCGFLPGNLETDHLLMVKLNIRERESCQGIGEHDGRHLWKEKCSSSLAQGLSCGKSNWRRNQGQIVGAVVTSLSKLPAASDYLDGEQAGKEPLTKSYIFLKNLNKGDSFSSP